MNTPCDCHSRLSPSLAARPVQVLESSTETVWPRAWAHACLFLSIYFSTSLLPNEQEVLRVSGRAGATGSSMSWLSPRRVRGPRRAVPLYLSAELPSSLHFPACFPLCSGSASPPFSWLRNFPWLNWEKFFICWGKLAATETCRQKSKKKKSIFLYINLTEHLSKAKLCSSLLHPDLSCSLADLQVWADGKKQGKVPDFVCTVPGKAVFAFLQDLAGHLMSWVVV